MLRVEEPVFDPIVDSQTPPYDATANLSAVNYPYFVDYNTSGGNTIIGQGHAPTGCSVYTLAV